MPTTAAPRFLAQLEGLRAVAALGVLITHVGFQTGLSQRSVLGAIDDAIKRGVNPAAIVRELFDTAISTVYVATGSPKDYATHGRIAHELGGMLATRARALFTTIRENPIRENPRKAPDAEGTR